MSRLGHVSDEARAFLIGPPHEDQSRSRGENPTPVLLTFGFSHAWGGAGVLGSLDLFTSRAHILESHDTQ